MRFLLAQQRTKTYFNHDGALFPGDDVFLGSLRELGLRMESRGQVAVSFVQNAYIRNHFTDNLELLAMGLDFAAYFPHDKQFVRSDACSACGCHPRLLRLSIMSATARTTPVEPVASARDMVRRPSILSPMWPV